MKKVLFPILLLMGYTSFSQELNGVWMSIDDPLEKLASNYNRGNGGIIFDFEDYVVGNIATSTFQPLTVNRKNTKIRANGIKGKLKVQSFDKDLLILKGAKKVTYAFKKLNLNHKIDAEREELNDFLINQHCGLIQNTKGRFTSERFFRDEPGQNRYKRNQFINITDRDNGYWYFTKIKGNVFLILTLGRNAPENIFQVRSLQVKGFNLSQLQDDDRIKNFTLLKTCL